MNTEPRRATAFAPATVANVAVGFDVLGYAFGALGDRVTVSRRPEGGVGIAPTVGIDVPREPERNTAGSALLALLEGSDLAFGFEVTIEKGVPMSSGLGGSAASAVAAVVAANAVLDEPRSIEELYPFALAGEAVASGTLHGDNVAPALFGGMVAVLPGESHGTPISLPVPSDLHCALVRPQIELETRAQRSVLPDRVALSAHAEQSGWLAGVVAALHSGDLDLLERCLRDVIVGPCRAPAIPAYSQMEAAARANGAIGFGISGSGPTVFAWCRRGAAAAVAEAMSSAVAASGVAADSWHGPVGGAGAKVEDIVGEEN